MIGCRRPMLFHPSYHGVVETIGTVTHFFLSVAYAIHEELTKLSTRIIPRRMTKCPENALVSRPTTTETSKQQSVVGMRHSRPEFAWNSQGLFSKQNLFETLLSETFLRGFFPILHPVVLTSTSIGTKPPPCTLSQFAHTTTVGLMP